MILSKSVGDKIVSQLSQIVEQHINIMDMEGRIISSTDPNRINSIHGGALKIIEEKLDELMILSDDEFSGAKNGINLPIRFHDEIVGVIGMTGRHDEVYKFGQIIRKMTEILLLEFSVREQYIIEQKARDRFLEEWVFGRYESTYPTEFNARAQKLGIDVKTPKRLIAFSVRTNEQGFLDDNKQTEVSHRIRNYLRGLNQAYLFRTSTLYIGVFNRMNDEAILAIVGEIKSIVTNHFGCQIFIGVDHAEEKSVQQSFKNANVAHQLALRTNQHTQIYDALNIDLYITRMPQKDREAFLYHLFPNVTKEEMKEFIKLLRTFFEENGSIEKTSKRLFIHKNTLQYRIHKIESITSKDPRKLSDSHLFIAAIRIYDSLNPI